MSVIAMRGDKLEKSRVNRIAKGYAYGGGVKSDAMMADAKPGKKPMFAKKSLGAMEGGKPKPRLDKGYAKGGAVKKGKDAKTNINVIVAPQGGGDKPPMLPPPGPPMGAAPPMMPPKPPMGPPVGPPGAMPPGLGPRPFKNGGPVRGSGGRFAKGGAVKMTAGSESGLGRLQKIAAQKRKGV